MYEATVTGKHLFKHSCVAQKYTFYVTIIDKNHLILYNFVLLPLIAHTHILSIRYPSVKLKARMQNLMPRYLF